MDGASFPLPICPSVLFCGQGNNHEFRGFLGERRHWEKSRVDMGWGEARKFGVGDTCEMEDSAKCGGRFHLVL